MHQNMKHKNVFIEHEKLWCKNTDYKETANIWTPFEVHIYYVIVVIYVALWDLCRYGNRFLFFQFLGKSY